MRIAFVGDIHGCALHALGALVGWQAHSGHRLDCAIQVGDFHAYPTETFPLDDWYVLHNPAERDALRILDPDERMAEGLRLTKDALSGPVYFISGNHEDFDWLDQLHVEAKEESVATDPLHVFSHLADGSVCQLAQQRIAVLGKIDVPGHRLDFDNRAYDRLMAIGPNKIDILVTHENPVGVPPGYLAKEGGSKRLTMVIERLQPWLHVCGHIHMMHGPRYYGDTVSYTVNLLVPPKTHRWTGAEENPEQHVDKGSIAIVNTETRSFDYVMDDWIEDIAGDDFDLAGYIRSLN